MSAASGRDQSRNRALALAAILILAAGFTGCASDHSALMTREHMEAYINSVAADPVGQPGALQFEYQGVNMACISDVDHDRMRLIAPITTIDNLDAQHLAILLTANYHTSLDARYATSKGVLYAAYLHPISSLRERDLASALRQVSSLVLTFGSTYSSGELDYGREQGEAL